MVGRLSYTLLMSTLCLNDSYSIRFSLNRNKAGRFDGDNQQGLLGDAPPQFSANGGGGGGRGGRGGGLFSKAVGGLVLERLGIRADHLIGAALNNLPPHVLDPTIVPKKSYMFFFL